MEARVNRRDVLKAAGMLSVGILSGCASYREKSSATSKATLPYRSATDLLATLDARQMSSVELVDFSIARIEALDPRINAVVVRDFDRARVTAREADAARARGELRPLLGLPMTVKESFNVTGMQTTWGLPNAKGWQPTEDAVAVARLKNAGAIIIGKTNIPRMLADFQSFNDVYGTTNNPWNLARTAGGSSGGSAAALAAGFISLELGSDFGGSIRVPASYCGVYGHKPTHGLVPLRGQAPPRVRSLPGWSDLAVAGPMARDAGDLMLELNVVAGPDISEAKAYRLALPPPRHGEIRNYRIVLIDQHPLIPTADAVRSALDRLGSQLEKAGCKVERSGARIPDLAQSAQLYAILQNAWDGRNADPETYSRLQAEASSIPADTTDLGALRKRSAVSTFRDWSKAHQKRIEMQQQWREAFRQFDVVICPVHPVPAWPHDHSPDRPARSLNVDGKGYPWMDTLRAWGGVATVPGLPATAAPIGLSDDGMPIGVQIIGPEYEDGTSIQFATLMAREFGGFVPPPAFG
jgi:amidase